MDLTTVYNIPVGDSYVKGKADAPVTIVEFTDLQCPFCSRFHGPITETLKAYPDKVKLVLKNFPLPMHPQSRPAAKAALAAGLQGKYFEMVDLLLQNQQSLGDDKFKELAGQLGMNVVKFTKDIQDNGAAWDKRFDAEMELGNNVGVRGTPTYFLNGKQTMARSADQWKAEIDALLKK
jgi:protein-disulfide isomerase